MTNCKVRGLDIHQVVMYIYIMQRTNIYLPADLTQKLQTMSREQRITFAQLVRTLIDERIKEKEKKQATSVLAKMAKNAKKSGLKNLGKHHDYYLYGKGRID